MKRLRYARPNYKPKFKPHYKQHTSDSIHYIEIGTVSHHAIRRYLERVMLKTDEEICELMSDHKKREFISNVIREGIEPIIFKNNYNTTTHLIGHNKDTFAIITEGIVVTIIVG